MNESNYAGYCKFRINSPEFLITTIPCNLSKFKKHEVQARENATKTLKPLESLPTSETLITRLRNG